MYSLQENYLKELRFNNEQLMMLKTLGEYQGKQALYFQQTPEVLETLRQVSLVESSESSNRIEGVIAPHHRILAIVLKNTKPINRSEQEIAGYRDVLSLIHESAQNMPFSKNLILQLHSMLYRYHPGRGGMWKAADNQIIEKGVGGSVTRVRFKPTSAMMTPHAMEDLVTSFHQAINQHQYEPLVIIPLTIFDFLCIHPFSDGNGRASRLLTLLLLYQFGHEVGRYISLERIFEDSKETYYEALEASSHNWHEQKHDVNPWLNYFWGALLRGYKELEERVGNIQTGKGYKTEQIKMAVKNRISEFTISDIEKSCPGVGRDRIRQVLRLLRDQGVIKSLGIGRSAKWIRVNPHE